MPVITVEGSQLTKDQKRDLVAALTKSASDIMKIPAQAFVVLVK